MVTITDAVTWMYVSVPVVSAAGWVPQITRLVRHPQLGLGMSVPTWGMWTFSGTVSLLYVLLVARDPLLVLTFSVNALGQAIVLGYALASRLAQRRGSTPDEGPGDDQG
jgi:hypothetical protein